MFKGKISGLYEEVQNYATQHLVNMLLRGSRVNGAAAEREENEEDDRNSSLALVPYQFPSVRTNGSSTNDTTFYSPDLHLVTFQCTVHAVVTAVRSIHFKL